MAIERISTYPTFSFEARTHYKESLTEKHRKLYERQMRKINRWVGDREISDVVAGLKENNMDHIFALADMAQAIRTSYPHLAGEINFGVVEAMIIIHDAGEIAIGDWPAVGAKRESPSARRFKALESKAIQAFITKYVKPKAQPYIRDIAERYEQGSSGDKEYLLTNILDKAHAATRTGMDYVFNPSIQGDRLTPALRERHMKSVRKMMQYVDPLLAQLSPEAGIEMQDVVDKELQRLRDNGFDQEVTTLLAERNGAKVLQ